MQKLIFWLFSYINHQQQIINYLCVLVFGKNFKPKPEKCTDKKYLKLSVDPLPVFGKPKIEQLWNYKVLLQSYRDKHGKNLKPVKNRGGKSVSADVICHYCGAPHNYIYDNTGGRGQFWCKVCNSKFNIQKPSKDDEPYCPYCNYKLELAKKRKSFDVYRCSNRNCSFRNKKLSPINPQWRSGRSSGLPYPPLW